MTNPMNILEQMTYLFFMKMLDDITVRGFIIDSVTGALREIETN